MYVDCAHVCGAEDWLYCIFLHAQGLSADALLAATLREKYPIEIFGLDRVSSSKASQIWREINLCDECCSACGTHKNLSRAHIIRRADDCAAVGLESSSYHETSNMLVLCGSKDEKGTCHHLFDNELMSFYCLDKAASTWKVVGGPHHDNEVTLPYNPHRSALHAHLARCLVNKSLRVNDAQYRHILTWKQEVTPPQPEGSSPDKPPVRDRDYDRGASESKRRERSRRRR